MCPRSLQRKHSANEVPPAPGKENDKNQVQSCVNYISKPTEQRRKVQARSLLIDEYVANSSSGDENKVLTILKRLWAVC
jgi:hypothetical protein